MKTTRKSKTTRRRRRDRWASLRRALLRRRQELLQQVRGQLGGPATDTTGATFNDIADQASDALSSEVAHGVAEIANADLKMIERALERIENRTYGRCENCGKPIPAGRLRALPFAELCVDCKREEEASEASRPRLAPPIPF